MHFMRQENGLHPFQPYKNEIIMALQFSEVWKNTPQEWISIGSPFWRDTSEEDNIKMESFKFCNTIMENGVQYLESN
jgi:hypothetical protein